jgi:DNA-binding winged helix-turn-helix (wHTH) protein
VCTRNAGLDVQEILNKDQGIVMQAKFITDNKMSIGTGRQAGRVWRFAGCECDELRRELRVNDSPIDLEPKPFDILLELLEQYPNVVRKEELTATIWEGNTVVPNSLPTAISKLRRALSDEDHAIVETVHSHGYKIVSEVQVKEIHVEGESLGLQPGDSVPGRENWILIRRLGPSEASDTWLAECPTGGEQRVFKFAGDGVRLRFLKREAAIFRYLKKTLGERHHFLRILDWNFETAPYFVEIEAGGPNLSEWAEAQGGLNRIPLEKRIQIMADIAAAVSTAHDVGVIHRDLKPANVLISPAGGAGYQVRIVDFGSGGLLEHLSPGAFEITDLDFSQPLSDSGVPISATLMYAAPELLKGQPSTASADVYSLGVMLFQMAVGDFHRAPLPGWEDSIADEVLREDIGLAASGDPQKRLSSAAGLAERLASMEQRRVHRQELVRAETRSREAEQALRRAQARRPWVVTSGAVLVAGLAASLALYIQAAHERNRANRQAAISASINRFVAQDLLARTDPFHAGKPDETLVAAVKRAASDIDGQFPSEPEVAARLHDTIATALGRRDEPADAIREYQRAAELFAKAGGSSVCDAIVEQLRSAMVETRSMRPESIAHATSILQQQKAVAQKTRDLRSDVPVWLAIAGGTIALSDNDAKGAAREFQAALDRAAGQKTFDAAVLLTAKHSLAAALLHLGEAARAEQLARELLTSYTREYGQDSPPTLQVRLLLAQALMNQGKHEEVVRETSAMYPRFAATFGEGHQLTMQVRLTRASSESSLEHWDAAIQDDLAAHETAVKILGPLSAVAVMSLSDASQAQCQAGRWAEGARNARSAHDSARQAFGEHGAMPDATAFALATCVIGSSQLDEATRLLAGIDPNALAQLTGDSGWFANVALAQGQIAYRRRDFAAAKQYVETARPVFEGPGAEPYQKRAFEVLRAALGGR